MKPPTRKPAKKPTAGLFSSPLFWCGAVLVITCIGLCMWIVPDEEGHSNYQLERFFDDMHIKLKGIKTLCIDNDCGLVAKSPIQRGDVVLKVPPEAIIDQRMILQTKIGEAMSLNNASILLKYVRESGVGPGFANVFPYAFFLAHAKMDPKSQLAPWIAAHSASPRMSGALYWAPEYDACLDAQSVSEAKALRKLLNASVYAAKEICEETPAACVGEAPPSEDLLRWGIWMYLSKNFQDQAIILGLDTARFNNAKGGLYPRWNNEEKLLDILAGDIAM